MNHFSLFFLSVFLSLFSSSYSWHFLLTEGQRRCVYEELPKKEVIKIEMKLLDIINNDPSQGVNVAIVESATQEVVQQKFVAYNTTTKMSYISQKGGQFEICTVTSTGSHWISENQKVGFEMRIIYDIDPALEDKKYLDAAKSSHMEGLYKTLRKLHARSQNLIHNQDRNRESESQLFDDNEAINQKILLCTIFQIVVIVISGVFQIFSLRSFLVKRALY